jgi:hypothetical protein
MTPKLTVDDIRHHAEEVRDIAKRDANRILNEQRTQTLAIAGVAVITLVSLAYFMGSRRGAGKVVCPELPAPYDTRGCP